MLRNIAVDTDLLFFKEKDKTKFLSYLKNIEDSTAIFSLDTPEQLVLDSEFKTISGKSIFTWLSLKQCCGFLNKNFYTLLTDISGKTKSSKLNYDSYCVSKRDASILFNIVVRRRFASSLIGKKIIKNNKSNVIESVVTDQYKRLSNYVFASKIEEVLKTKAGGYSFNQATVQGRKVQLRYVFDEEFNLKNSGYFSKLTPLKIGILFSNSEHGNSSVKITLFLSFGELGCAAVPFNSYWSLDHKGQNFFNKIGSLLNVVDKKRKEFDEDSVDNMLMSLKDKSLGLSGVKERDDKWLRAINKSLVGGNVASKTADKVLKRTLFSNSDGVVSFNPSEISEKTALDVFMSMLIEGSKTLNNMAARDNIEQSSFNLLSGKVRI